MNKLLAIIIWLLFANTALAQTIDPRILPPNTPRGVAVDGTTITGSNPATEPVINLNSDGDIDTSNPSGADVKFDIKAGAVTDSKVTGPLSKSKLPSATGYKDETNAWSLGQTFNGAVTIGGTGSFSINGSTGGTISFLRAASFTNYNWYWPTAAGTTGQPLLSAGGANPMTFGTLGLLAGGTNRSTAWIASRCVRVNDTNTALEPAAGDCGTGTGGSGHVIYDTGGAFTQRSKLRFLGTPVSIADNAGNDSTDVTITTTVNQAGNYTWTGTHSIRDGNFSILGSDDQTKGIRFEVDGLPVSTIRVYTTPNADTNLLGGSDIGSSVQAYNAKLAAISGLTWAADQVMYATGASAANQFTATSFSRGLMANTDAAGWRTSLGLAIGTNVQAYDAQLADLAGLTPTANRLLGSDASNFLYFTVPSSACTDAVTFDPATRTFTCASFPAGTISGTTGNLAVFTGSNAVGNGSAYISYGASGPQLTGISSFGTPGSDKFSITASGLSGKGTVNVVWAWRGASVNMGFTCGTLTENHFITINADGCMVDGGAGGTVTPASTDTFTNKTIDTEDNVFKTTVPYSWEVAGCDGSTSTAGAMMDLPTSNSPTPTCFGATTTFGTLSFPDGSTTTASRHWKLTGDWNNAVAVDITLVWFSTSSSTNSARWCVATGGKGTGETVDAGPAYNAASCDNVANTGANQRVVKTFTNVAMTNVAAGESFWVQSSRIGGDANDNLAAAAELMEMEVVIRVTK